MKFIPLVVALAALAGCTTSPPRPSSLARGDYAPVQRYVTQLIRHEMDESKVTGLSIALVDDQRIVWSEGFGYADRERGIPASAETLYRVGSISKLFTDTAAMQLAEAGRIDIDRPLRQYLPEFSVRTRYAGTAAITPRQLMTHHSGLPRDLMKGFMNPDPQPFTEVLQRIRENDSAYPPGLVFSYSNVGITLLGHAIQQVSGVPYADYMQQSLLNPLGMTHSSFDPGPSASPLMAKGYRRGEAATEPALRDVPAGGLNSSVADLSRFMSMLFADGKSGERQVLKPETLAEMLRVQNTAVPLDLNFRIGLGWMLSTLGPSALRNAGPVAHHAGATPFFRGQMYVLPEHKLGVVVLANANSAGRVVDRVATETLALALEAKAGIRQIERGKAPPADRDLSAAAWQDYVGDYTTTFGFAHVYTESDRLRADALGRNFKLIPRGDGQLGLDYALLGLFHVNLGTLGDIGLSRRTVAGRDLLVARIDEQEMLAGQRIDPPANLGAWRQRIGEYEIANLGADHRFADRIRVTEEHGFLLVEISMTDALAPSLRTPFMPLSDSEGLLLGPLGDAGETVRSVTVDGEERLAFSGYLLRKIAP